MSFVASVIITLCAIFPPWVVAIALSFVTLVVILVAIKIVAFVLEAIPFI